MGTFDIEEKKSMHYHENRKFNYVEGNRICIKTVGFRCRVMEVVVV